MMQTSSFIILIFFCTVSFSQTNLVPNPSFEFYTDCPYGYSLIDYDEVVFPSVINWMKPTQGTSDYYHTCADPISGVQPPDSSPGYQIPFSGNAYTGMYTHYNTYDYREYVQARLTEPLVAGQIYFAGFYVNAAVVDGFWGCGGISDDIGMYISDTRITDFTSSLHLDVIPQIENEEGLYFSDTSNWYLVSGIYESVGGEEWITIGNFKDKPTTDYLELSASGGTCVYLFVDDAFIIAETLLPLNLLDFSGEIISSNTPYTLLRWTTASEINACCFTVQHSSDGQQFKDIGNVQANNSQNGANYSFNDNAPIGGINYYRLKQKSLKDNETFSQIIALNNSNSLINTYVKNGSLFIFNGSDNSLSAELYSITSSLLNSKEVLPGVTEWNEKIPPGIYLIVLKGGGGVIEYTKVIYL